MVLLLAASTMQLNLLHAKPYIINRQFSIDVGTAVVKVEVSYPQIFTAGNSYNINVSIQALDLGKEKYVEIRYLSVELEGTSIGFSHAMVEKLASTSNTLKVTVPLKIVDPIFREIKEGEKASYNLGMLIKLYSEGENEEESVVEYFANLPVYVYSPPLYFDVDVLGPSEAVENENFTVTVIVRNIGNYSIINSGLALYGPIDVYGTNKVILGAISPGKEKKAAFIVSSSKKDEIIISANVWALNAAEYNCTARGSITVNIKGKLKIEFYANESNGQLKLYGWVSPSRPYASLTIQEKRGTEWTPIATVSIDTTGYFEYVIKNLKLGEHVYRAVWAGDEEYAPVQSKSISVYVDKVPSTIIISASGTSISNGEHVELKGSINPPVSATVHIFVDCGDGWTSPGYAEASNGTFSTSITINAPPGSTCKIKAAWLGNANTLGSESNIVEIKIEKAGILWANVAAWVVGGVAVLVIGWLVVKHVRSKRVQVRS